MSKYQTVLFSYEFASALLLIYGIHGLRTGRIHKRMKVVTVFIRNAFFDNVSNESEIYKLFEAMKSS